MKSKYLSSLFLLTLSIISFPGLAQAHFASPHEPFWHEPMHFLIQHYDGLLLIAVGLVAFLYSWKKQTKKEK